MSTYRTTISNVRIVDFSKFGSLPWASQLGNCGTIELINNQLEVKAIAPVSLYVVVSCDATVANRYLLLKLKDSKNDVKGEISSELAISASQTGYITASDVYHRTFYNSGNARNFMPFPCVLVPPEHKLTAELMGGVVGDSWTLSFLYKTVPIQRVTS